MVRYPHENTVKYAEPPSPKGRASCCRLHDHLRILRRPCCSGPVEAFRHTSYNKHAPDHPQGMARWSLLVILVLEAVRRNTASDSAFVSTAIIRVVFRGGLQQYDKSVLPQLVSCTARLSQHSSLGHAGTHTVQHHHTPCHDMSSATDNAYLPFSECRGPCERYS